MANWETCSGCGGSGKVVVIIRGKATQRTCYACGGSGKVNKGLI